MFKYNLITNGCSFTRQLDRVNIHTTDVDFMSDIESHWRWPHHIQDLYEDIKVYNLGTPTNDSYCTMLSTIHKVQKLLDAGIDSSKIKVIVQWTHGQRSSWYIDTVLSKLHNSYIKEPFINIEDKIETLAGTREPYNAAKIDKKTKYLESQRELFYHITDFLEPNLKKYVGEYGYFILSGSWNVDHTKLPIIKKIFDSISPYVSDIKLFMDFYSNVVNLQNYLKLHNIDYKFFDLENNFNFKNEGKRWLAENKWSLSDIYVNKINNAPSSGFNCNNLYLKNTFELIDLDNYIFYSDDIISNGGIMEWAIRNFDVKVHKQLFMEHPIFESENDLAEFLKSPTKYRDFNGNMWGHVSSNMNRKWVKENLTVFLEN